MIYHVEAYDKTFTALRGCQDSGISWRLGAKVGHLTNYAGKLLMSSDAANDRLG